MQSYGPEPVKVATLNNFPPFSFRVKGKLMGFTIDYLHLLEQKTGLAFEIIDGTWEQNLRRFKSGEVDLVTAISYTKGRTSFTRFTEPYYIIPTVVYIREGSFAYQGVRDLRGKTVGIETGVFYKEYLQEYPTIKIREVEDTNELLKQLSFAEIDAVVTNINIGNYMKKKHMLENVTLAGRIDIPAIKDEDLRIGVRRELPELHSVVQDGINQISPREYKSLQDRWVGFTPSTMLQGNLLPEEYALIERYRHKYGGFRLGCHPAWYPIDFLDSAKSHAGIAADVFSLVSRKQKTPFTVKETDSFHQSLTALQSGKADVIPAVVPTTRLRDKLSFTKPYLSLPLVIATRNSEIFINDLNSLDNKRIGYVKRGVLVRTLTQNYPRLSFFDAGSVREGLQRVRDKRDFAFVGSIPAISYAIQNHSFYNIKVSGTLTETLPIAAAVKKGNDDLLRIVQKGLNSIPLQTRENVVDNWTSIRFDEKVDSRIVWSVVGGAALAVLLVVVWNRNIKSLNTRISEANLLLAQKNRQLEKLSVTDKLTGLYNRSKLETVLEEERKRFDRIGTPFSIIILDIDRFKSINDAYGHVTGDKILKMVAGRIGQRAREVDIAGRWGGEEFLIICPGTDEHGAGRLAEDIRLDLQEHDFGLERGLTVSAGYAAYKETDQGIEGFVNAADKGLYQAKIQRNRVVNGRETGD
ncbi:MAG: transporter substrate-binding domain-containing protein [Desulfohalobiaceae bacterium]|nr:transporter substrate-binding domain-containing protein [Desulfohalobiaceae bacterium]